MHGDYKTPGGKLVRVDFEIRDGALCDVVVSGDFFLYPEEALGDITAALEGAPTDLGEEDFAARVEDAIPSGAVWLGSSPSGLATAVRRALTIPEDAHA
jgi:lipoate---protein ligase